jgi:hypothetical protein
LLSGPPHGCDAGSAPSRRAGVDRLDDGLVAGAPAQVRGDHLADLLLARLGPLGEEPLGEHQEAGSAEPALQRVVIGERPLQIVQFTAARPTATRPCGSAPLGLRREHQAGAYGPFVDQDRAGAADPVLAADVRTGQPQFVPKYVDEGAAGLGDHVVLLAVDVEGDQLEVDGSPRGRCS